MYLLAADIMTFSIVMAVVRFTLVLSVAWLIHFAIRRSNRRWSIFTWRLAIACSFVALFLCMYIRGWGPQFDWSQTTIMGTEPTFLTVAPTSPPVEALPASGALNSNGPQLQNPNVGRQADQSVLTRRLPVPFDWSVVSILSTTLLTIYGLVVGMYLLGWVVQYLRLRKVLRQSKPAGQRFVSILQSAARNSGLRRQPQLVLSRSVGVPFATGLRNLIIVLPVEMTEELSTEELEMVLTHECGHFSGGDLFWTLAIQIFGIIAWPHPLCWGIASSHRFACDVRCDQLASRKSTADYCSVLAQWALKAHATFSPSIAMSMVHQAEALQRIRLVQSHAASRPGSRIARNLIPLLAIVLLSSAATFGINHFAASLFSFQGNQDELGYVSMQVAGKDGKPISGAEVTVLGVRAKKESASAYGIRRQVKAATTNSTGIANVAYPKYAIENLETGAVIFQVTHSDFVRFESQGNSVESPIEVVLDAGRRIELTLNSDSQTKDDNVFVLQPTQPPVRWSSPTAGTYRSPPVNPTESVLMTMAREQDGLLFSEIIHIGRLPSGDLKLNGIRLSPGRTLRGKLSDQVSRPVRNGKVGLAIAASTSATPSYENCIFWSDTVEILEDGSFEFKSIPRNVDVQLVANCDGWVSESALPDEIIARFPYVTTQAHAKFMNETIVIAQKFSSELAEVTVQMEPTADCEFTIVDPAGNAVPGALISMSPNKAVSPGPGGIVGMYGKTSDLLDKSQIDTPKMPRSASQYVAKTDSLGKVTIRNLPRKKSIGVSIEHENFELPIPALNPFHRSTVADLSTGSTKMEIKLQRKGTQPLGR